MSGQAQPEATVVPRVTVRGTTKVYGVERALEDVSLSMAPGAVHALVGANGAGKSTLGKVIAGAVSPSAGEILIDGRPTSYSSPRGALAHGVALIAQELALAPDMTVLDNVFLGTEPRRRSFVDRGAMRSAFSDLLDRSGFTVPPQKLVRDLGPADQQKVEILRAVNREAKVIVMDEPTSSLTGDEVDRLLAVVRSMRDAGTTIIYVSHFLREVLELSDQVSILRNGRLIRTTNAVEETEESLVTGMLGHSAAADFPARTVVAAAASPVLEVEHLSRDGVLDDVSFSVHAGEIVGLAGLVGSGRTEVARAVFGVDTPDGGRITIEGRRTQRHSPLQSFRNGVAYLPESRKEEGLFMEQSAAMNTTLPHLGAPDSGLSRFGWVARRSEKKEVQALLRNMSIKPDAPTALVRTMSGGNQQKVLLAKCLFTSPRLLILDEPTRGVDVAARRAIHDLISQYAGEGGAVLLISSDLEELIGLAHRNLVMHRGRLVSEFGADPEMEDVLQASFGITPTHGEVA